MINLEWRVSASGARAVRSFVRDAQADALVRSRVARNLAGEKPAITHAAFWRSLVGAVLTTQQPSGPKGAVNRFMTARPFPLSYDRCRKSRSLGAFVTATLTRHGGLRRTNRIGEELAENFALLENGAWRDTMEQVNSLRFSVPATDERNVANMLADRLWGLGPKQSRNVLQALGLTRYEIPIDSRITRWLNARGFPLRITSAALSDRYYYEFVLDGIQRLCAAAAVFPCVFDAAVFASFDNGGWRPEDVEDWGESED